MDIQLVENLVEDAWVTIADEISTVVDNVAAEFVDSGLVKEGEQEQFRERLQDAFTQHADEFVRVLSDGVKQVLKTLLEMSLEQLSSDSRCLTVNCATSQLNSQSE